MTTYFDLQSLGPDSDTAIARCKQLGLVGALIPANWRYQVLLQASGDDTIICGPLALNFWRKLPPSCNLVSIAALGDSDPLPNRFATWEEWGLRSLPRSQIKALLAKPPTYRHAKYQEYQNAMGMAYIMKHRTTQVPLIEFEQLVASASQQKPSERPYQWTLVTDDNVTAIMGKLAAWEGAIGLDCETDIVLDHPNEMVDLLIGIGIATGNNCYYFPRTYLLLLWPILSTMKWVAHNGKYDICVIQRALLEDVASAALHLTPVIAEEPYGHIPTALSPKDILSITRTETISITTWLTWLSLREQNMLQPIIMRRGIKVEESLAPALIVESNASPTEVNVAAPARQPHNAEPIAQDGEAAKKVRLLDIEQSTPPENPLAHGLALNVEPNENHITQPTVVRVLNKAKGTLHGSTENPTNTNTLPTNICISLCSSTNLVGDSMLAAYLHGVPEAGLKKLVWDKYQVRMITYDDVVGSGKKRKKISEIDQQLVAEYCCGDAYWGLRMEADLMAELDTQKQQLYQSDLSLVPVLLNMQFDGTPLDRHGAQSKLLALEDQKRALAKIIDQIATESGFPSVMRTRVCTGCRNGSRKRVSCNVCRGVGKFSERVAFNPGSSDQVVQWLHYHLQLPVQGRTTGGEASVDALSLLRLRPLHVAPQLLLMYKQTEKYIGFLKAWLEWSRKDGQLHPVFTMARTRSGRHSSSDPNVQQVKGEWREFFVPPEGRMFITADYGQIEVRIPAFLSGDPGLVAAMTASGGREADLHAQNVERIFGVSYEKQQEPDFDKSMRTRAKNFLFGAFYGSKGTEIQAVIEKALLQDDALDVAIPTQREIAAAIRVIQDSYPNYFHQWVPAANHKCRENGGWSSTLYGHVRYLPDILSSDKYLREAAERANISHIIQGTAGDIIRFAKLGVAKYITEASLRADLIRDWAVENRELTLHLTVHDELVISATRPEAHVDTIRSIMELDQPFKPIPLVVDVNIGAHWGLAHK